MSQSGILNSQSSSVPGNVAQAYVTNAGTAVPAANVLNVLGAGSIHTAGSGNTVTISLSGSIVETWTDEAVSFNAIAGNGYFVTANATATTPASPSQGDTLEFAVDSVSGILTIQANTGQKIRVGTTLSMLAGTCASNFDGDSIRLVFRSSDSTWITVTAPQGTWSVT